jgi:hypothetical protein
MTSVKYMAASVMSLFDVEVNGGLWLNSIRGED